MSKDECSICMEVIISNINICTTECGHCFHSNCLIKNISHNGFGCPYCRKMLAEKPLKMVDLDIEDDDNGEEGEVVNHIDVQEQDYIYNDYELRGFRWLFNRAFGEEIEQYGYEKPYEDVYLEEFYEEKEKIKNLLPTFLVNEIMMKNNISYEELLEYILSIYIDDYKLSYQHQESFKKVYTIICKIEKQFPLFNIS
jgi:hypothetical protein